MTQRSAADEGRRFRTIALGALVLCALILCACFGWVHPETSFYFEPVTLQSKGWIKESFNFPIFDHRPRPRVLSNLADILGIALRHWVSPSGQLPASLSLAWGVVFILIPFGVRRLTRALKWSTWEQWAAILLSLASSGVLSGAAMQFHSGKPVAMALTVWAMAWAVEGRWSVSFSTLGKVLLLSTAMLWDESSIFIWGAWGWILWNRRKAVKIRSQLSALFFSFGLAGFLAWLIVPLFATFWGYPEMNVFEYVASGEGPMQFGLKEVLRTFWVLWSSHLGLWTEEPGISAGLRGLGLAISGGLLGGLAWGLFKIPNQLRFEWGLLVGFGIFQALLGSRFPVLIQQTRSAYYYGGLFSVLVALVLSRFLAQVFGKTPKLQRGVLCSLAILFLVNFWMINTYWIDLHRGLWSEYYPKIKAGTEAWKCNYSSPRPSDCG